MKMRIDLRNTVGTNWMSGKKFSHSLEMLQPFLHSFNFHSSSDGGREICCLILAHIRRVYILRLAARHISLNRTRFFPLIMLLKLETIKAQNLR